MKTLNLVKQYHKLTEHVDDYLLVKLNLEDVVSDSFALITMEVVPSDTVNFVRAIVDIVDFVADELVYKCWIEFDANELDRFITDPKTDMAIWTVNALNKFKDTEEEEEEAHEKCDCPNCTIPLKDQN